MEMESLPASADKEGFIAGDERTGNKLDSSYLTISLMLFFSVRNFCSCQNSYSLLDRGKGWLCFFVLGILCCVYGNQILYLSHKTKYQCDSRITVLHVISYCLYIQAGSAYFEIIFKVSLYYIVRNNIVTKINSKVFL